MSSIILVGIVILIIIVVAVVLFRKSKHGDEQRPSYAVLTDDGFTGVPISQLAQPKEFYLTYHEATLRYLQAVYPAARDTLKSLSILQLASFYNSLWFYYNCSGKYTDSDIVPFQGTAQWDALPCATEVPLPYTPQGWLYNFYTYNKFNVPEIYSDSDPSVSYLKLQNASSGRAGVMGTYLNNSVRSSGIMWLPNRTIQRDVWYPNGLFNQKALVPNAPDKWVVQNGLPTSFHFPEGWYGELGDGSYIEVTHSPSETGDAINQSPWWWYNVCPGSGMFLQLGKTIAVKNKISGIFIMAQRLAQTEAGKVILRKWYNSTDPYVITWGIVGLCGYDATAKQTYCDFNIQECGRACNPGPVGYSRAANHPFSNFYQEALQYQNNVLKDPTNYPTADTIRKAIDLAVDNKNYNLAHVAEHLLADETNFFFGIQLGLDTIQFYEDPNGNDNYVFEIIDLRIPSSALAAAKQRDYSGFMTIATTDAKPILIGTNRWKDPQVAHHNRYREDAIQEYLKNAYDKDWISIRDPFDVFNDSRVIRCEGLSLEKVCESDSGPGYARSMYCKGLYFSNQWKCLSLGGEFNACQLQGSNINC